MAPAKIEARLKELLDAGMITEKEYKQMKAKLAASND